MLLPYLVNHALLLSYCYSKKQYVPSMLSFSTFDIDTCLKSQEIYTIIFGRFFSRYLVLTRAYRLSVILMKNRYFP